MIVVFREATEAGLIVGIVLAATRGVPGRGRRVALGVLAGQAAGLLQQGGFLETLQATVWDSSALLSDSSIGGKLLHTLIGYTDRPSSLQVVAYAATLATILLLSHRHRVTLRRTVAAHR